MLRQPANTREAAKNTSSALARYRKYLQASLSCISKTTWLVLDTGSRASLLVLATAEDPVRLRRALGYQRLFLTASQNFRIGPHPQRHKEMKVFTEAYSYQLYNDQELTKAGESLLWHWHPGEGFSEPHVHIGPASSRTKAQPKLHIPSGRVSFESVVRFLITDLNTRPERDDWRETLSDTEARFDEYKTWGMKPPKAKSS